MSRRRISIESFCPKQSDKVLLDTNILIKLFYPIDFAGVEAYDDMYKELLKKKSALLITAIQISEFINRCIRLQFKLYQKAKNDMSIDYKRDYRVTQEYREHMDAILDIVRMDIIPNFQIIDDKFSQLDLNNVFIYGFSYDFNDAFLVEVARKQQAMIVTSDADFANYNASITIVTDNRFLLQTR